MRTRLTFLAVSLLLSSAAAWADSYGTLTMTYLQDSPTQRAWVYGPGVVAGGQDCYVGRSNFSVTGYTLPVGGGGNPLSTYVGTTITGYCVDLYQWISPGYSDSWIVADVSDAPQGNGAFSMGDPKALRLSELFYKYEGAVGNDGDKAAAFQAAVWAIVYDDPTLVYDVTSSSESFHLASDGYGGDFASWTGQANTWLNSLGNLTGQTFSVIDLNTQDFAVIIPGTGSPPVPEPVTMFSALLALSGLGRFIRKRMKAPAVA